MREKNSLKILVISTILVTVGSCAVFVGFQG